MPYYYVGFFCGSDALRSPNENYGISNYFKGIETIALFHRQFAAVR
jgi:hypothetical protein